MAKARTNAFFCKECGYESSKWMGQCPACHAWNTLVEAPVAQNSSSSAGGGRSFASSFSVRGLSGQETMPVLLSQIPSDEEERVSTGIGEFDRVLGGGIVPGSLILVGGDPGIGKSTLLLQACRNLAASGERVLYISGEESLKQIKMRADRIGKVEGELRFYCETSLNRIERVLTQGNEKIAVIDSIQTICRDEIASAAGSVGQVRESTAILLKLAKSRGIAIFVVGHVTKEGVVAGPRILEHMVDTVLYFEGDRSATYRILRAVKNRFGSTNEIGVFEMAQEGLAEVQNPSEYLLNGRPDDAAGAVVSCSLEGTRPILLEVQALVAQTNFGMPRRTTAGTDYNRVNLLMAVLEKRCHYEMSRLDAYINIAGGMRMNEPALDLAVVLALVSSFKDRAVEEGVLVFGEVGLSGEVRAVQSAVKRVNEAARLGFNCCILPQSNSLKMKEVQGMRLIGVSNVREAIRAAFS